VSAVVFELMSVMDKLEALQTKVIGLSMLALVKLLLSA
jgi:hypothetical protein